MPIRRGTVIVVGVALILLLVFIFVVPILINVDRCRSQVISYLQEKTGKQVEIGRLALTFFPVTIHIDHIGVKNPPIFPSGYVAQVARIDAELSVGTGPPTYCGRRIDHHKSETNYNGRELVGGVSPRAGTAGRGFELNRDVSAATKNRVVSSSLLRLC